MMRRIYRVMIQDYVGLEAEATIAMDWEHDAQGNDTLSRKRFCDAFFELADTVIHPQAGCPLPQTNNPS